VTAAVIPTEASEYAATARSVRESGEALIDAGQAGIAGPVLRKAVDRITRALEHLDDSSGIIGDQLRATMPTYARACTVTSPAPKSLASWLVKLHADLGDQTGALQVRQTEFECRPLATTYASWAATASATDAPNPLPHALQMLRERTTHQPDLAAEIIPVLQVSGHDEDAWQVATTHRRQVDRYQWVDRRAGRRATSHPEDIIQPYEDMIEDHLLDSRDARRYRQAVAYLPALGGAYTATGRPEASPPT
jgi:hypothetical protein